MDRLSICSSLLLFVCFFLTLSADYLAVVIGAVLCLFSSACPPPTPPPPPTHTPSSPLDPERTRRKCIVILLQIVTTVKASCHRHLNSNCSQPVLNHGGQRAWNHLHRSLLSADPHHWHRYRGPQDWVPDPQGLYTAHNDGRQGHRCPRRHFHHDRWE